MNRSAELDDLFSQVPLPRETRCSATEYITLNREDLPTCSDKGDETWEEDFFSASLNSDQHFVDEEPEDALFDIKPPPKIKFCLAMDALENVKSFLDRKG